MTDKPQFVGKKVKLGELCEICSGGTPKRSVAEYWKDGTIPWVKIGDMSEKYVSSTEERITDAGFNNSSVKMLEPGTLLYSIFASIGAVSILKIPATTNQAIAGLKIKDDSLDRDFLYHYLKSRESISKSSGRGAAQNNINLTILRNMQVTLPSIEIQRSIVRNLEMISNQVTIAESHLMDLDALVKSRFVEMFGDPIRNPLRMSVSSVEELAAPIKNSMKAGPFGSALKKEVYAESGYKVYGQEQVISGNQFLGNYYIDKEKYEQLNSCKVMPGDVLISLVGTVGKVLILSEDCQPGIINPRLVKITFDKRKIFPEYFAIAFSLESVRSSLLGRAHGQTMNVLNLGMIKKLKLPVPPISRQKEYLNFVAQVDKSRFGGMLHLLNSLSGIMHASFFSVADTD